MGEASGWLGLGGVFGSHGVAEVEVALCFGYVSADLFAKSFGVGPADLRAEAVQEGQSEGRLFVEGDGVEV